MILYHYDQRRIYTHSSETNEFAPVPPNTTFVEPPTLTGTEVARWDGIKSGWTVLPEYPNIVPSIDDLKSKLKDKATNLRWTKMTGGLTLPSGIEVNTTVDDQNRITSVVANANLAGLTDEDEVDFKAASGWVRVTIGQIKSIAGAIGQFVQACYSAERAHHEAIDALDTREDVEAYDVTVGWPE